MRSFFEEMYFYVLGVAVGLVAGIVLTLVYQADSHADGVRASAGISFKRSLPVVVTQHSYARDYGTSSKTAAKGRAKAKYKIAIIDTGYSEELAAVPIKLCKDGHYDFYSETPTLAHTVSHGTFVATIIAAPLADVDYCAVIYQVVDKNGNIEPANIARAVMMASKEHVNAVNMSITGNNSSLLEQRAIKTLTDSGASVFVAAGNDHRDLDYACQSFPACYGVENLFAVGALTADLDQPAQYSNHGSRVKLWYTGVYYDGVNYAQGTSFASPRAAADYVLSISSKLPQH